MLFFEDVKAEMLEDEEFRTFYARECHICATTMGLVSKIETMGPEGTALLERLGISGAAFSALAQGDCCRPEEVARMADALGMGRPDFLDTCPRASGNATGGTMREEGRGNGRQ